MSYSKDWRAYPPAFEELVRRAAVGRVEISFPDPAAALRIVNKLHAYFGVLHRSALKQLELAELDALSRRVQIKAIGASLVAIPRDLDPDNLAILKGLEALPSAPLADVPMSTEMREMFAKSLTNPPG